MSFFLATIYKKISDESMQFILSVCTIFLYNLIFMALEYRNDLQFDAFEHLKITSPEHILFPVCISGIYSCFITIGQSAKITCSSY